MSRRYEVTQTNAGAGTSSAVFADPGTALVHFAEMLSAAGHEDEAVRMILHRYTAVLMSGAMTYSALDPDLKGSVAITITL